MSSSEYVLCKWHSRLWPAKVLSVGHPNSKDVLLTVELLCLEERIEVKAKDTKPFKKTKIEAIADKLVKGKEADSPDATIADLTYRKALRIALEILNSTLGISPAKPRINILKGCKETPCNNVVLERTEITQGEKQESKTTGVQNKTPVKRKVCKPNTLNQRKPSTPITNTTRCSENSTEDLITGNHPTNNHTLTKRRRTIDSSINKDGDTSNSEKEPAPCTTGNLDTPGVKRKSRAARRVNQDSMSSINKPSKKEADEEEGESRLHELEVKETEKVKDRPLIQRSHEEKTLRKEICKATEVNSKSQTNVNTGKKPAKRYKQLPMPEFEDEKGLTSPELSMEFSSSEDCIPAPAWSTEDTEEDEDLPSVLHGQCQGTNSIEPGMFVWCKYQRFPYWPSVVSSVKKKERKARVYFVEKDLSDPNSKTQTFPVPFVKLKHYDCEEKQQLLDAARIVYEKYIDWCDKFISDYRISVGCSSFTGSFKDYCTADISYPVRRELQNNDFGELFTASHSESTASEIEATPSKSPKGPKLLPDREHAARDRANKKLVELIVKSKQAEKHLQDILARKKKSRWLNNFLTMKNHISYVDPYVEDEEQIDHIVGYLQSLCDQNSDKAKDLMKNDRLKFILDVLLPEAIIFAISAVDKTSYEKAEKKYMDGPTVSKRERSQFEAQILKMKRFQNSS